MAYGGDENFIGDKKSFKEWVLAQDQYDMSKFAFVGRLNPPDLAQTLAAGDLHIYLTVPFVLSWSMMDAMSCGAVVLASATTPVKEMIQEGQNGLLADFFNVEELASKAVAVLKDPSAARALGRAAEQLITEKYSLEAVVPEMIKLYEETASRAPRQAAPVVQMEPTYANGRPAPARPTGGATDVFTGMPAAPPRRPPSKSPFFG
jgi:glycosyltransferase involved in cell wall biosynthesis